MATSYTTLLGLALPATGELSGTWGDTVNNYISTYVDSAVAGTQTISGSQTAVTLSVTNGSSLVQAGAGATGSSQYTIINCTGNPASLLTVTVPAASKSYLVINSTSTSQSVKIVGAGPTTGVTLVPTERAIVAWNGSDFVKVASTSASTINSGTLAAAYGGTGINSLGTGVATFLGTPSSSNLAAAVTDETGSGALVFATSPTLVTPVLGTPQSGNFSSGAFTWPTFNQNTTGTAAGLSATLAVGSGGTGQTTYTDGQLLIGNSTGNTLTKATLTQGTGVTITNSAGGITISATGSGGTVTSVTGSGNIASSGGTTPNITFTGTLPTANGGTGLTSFTANGVVYASSSSALTTGSALTFNGTNLVTTGSATGTAFIPSGSTVPSNGMYLPTTNTVAWSTNTTGQMSLNSSGNLGLGVTSSAWSLIRAIQFAGNGMIGSYNNQVYVASNWFYDGTDKYISSGFATRYFTDQGAHIWATAPSGTAGNAITFTQAMTLNASGALLIGQTSTLTQEVLRVASSGQASMLLDNTGKTNGAFVGAFNDAALFSVNRNPSTGNFYNASNRASDIVLVGSAADSYIIFETSTTVNTAPTERMRIDASGNLLVGGTAARGTTVGTAHLDLFNGTAPAGTLTNGVSLYSSSGDLQFMDAAGNAYGVGFRNIPQNSQSAAYTLVLADAGKHIFHPSTDANARTYTIPANSSVAYPIGTAITFINMTSQVVTIAITTDTMYLSSAGTTGSRSLAQYGSATAIKMTSTTWLISGSGLT